MTTKSTALITREYEALTTDISSFFAKEDLRVKRSAELSEKYKHLFGREPVKAVNEEKYKEESPRKEVLNKQKSLKKEIVSI